MRTYVTSTDQARANYVHIGDDTWTACGHIVAPPFTITLDCPPDRGLCPRCAARFMRRRAAPRPPGVNTYRSVMGARVLALLCDGMTQKQIARELRVGLRTVNRYVTDGRTAIGARTLFQWGYFHGRASRD